MPPPVREVMGDDEFHREMQEALASVVTGPAPKPPPCQDNITQFEGRPCKRCGGTRRYFSNGACVACITDRTRRTSNKAVRERAAKEYDL
jgi:hypothetical protein